MINYQQECYQWVIDCFGQEIANNIKERRKRFLEEAIELVQASGATKAEVVVLVDYVFGRSAGDKHQELGGVMVTLASLCTPLGLDLEQAAIDELQRAKRNSDKIKNRHKSKPASILG